LSVDSIALNEITKCGGKFSKDFFSCIKIAENAQTNNHSKHTEIYVKTRKEKTTRGRFYFNLKELQAEISDFVIIGALEFLLSPSRWRGCSIYDERITLDNCLIWAVGSNHKNSIYWL